MVTQSDTLTQFCEKTVSCAAVKRGFGPRVKGWVRERFGCETKCLLPTPKMTPSTALSLQLAKLNEPSFQEIRNEFLLAPLFGYSCIIISCTVHDSPSGISPRYSKDGTMAASNAAGAIGSSTEPTARTPSRRTCGCNARKYCIYWVRMCRRRAWREGCPRLRQFPGHDNPIDVHYKHFTQLKSASV